MSVPPAEPVPVKEPSKDAHGCIIGKEKWDETTKTCVPIVTEPAAQDQPVTASQQNVIDATVAVIKEYVGKILETELKPWIHAEIKKTRDESQAEIKKGIRTGLGLVDNPVVHMNDLKTMLPKMLKEVILETAPGPDKAALQKDAATSPDGTTATVNPIDKMIEDVKL